MFSFIGFTSFHIFLYLFMWFPQFSEFYLIITHLPRAKRLTYDYPILLHERDFVCIPIMDNPYIISP
ncbi:hypothetical protein Lalb_Chr24g0400471 [Lupinus albus]|uniref:Uncharacterized protein n=1 Tax=Lupinus albus TaxID=3870 RepID=A0A6A4N8H4_LUPAL|nr:hypothetical protein Lalb_Chr24g0400471 [Lupinus albus]